MTTTINVNFGAWIDVGGFILNDALTNFSLPGDAACSWNVPDRGKRPQTAMAPVIGMTANDHVMIVGGSAGGGEIVDYVAQALIQIIHGATPLAALDAGHVSTARAPYKDSPGLVELEMNRGIAELADALRSRGHPIKIAPLQSGLGFLVWRDGWSGAADPRRDGNAVTGRSAGKAQ